MARCPRLPSAFLPMLLALASPVAAVVAGDGDGLEAQVVQIEQLATSASPDASNALIRQLEARGATLTTEQRQRIEYVRLRNLGLLGEQAAAVQGMVALLGQKLSPGLRTLTYATAANMAANLEDWPRAFGLLEQSQREHLVQTPESAVLFSAAAYLYALVDDLDRARKLGRHALHLAENEASPAVLCRALAVFAMVEERAGQYPAAELLRARQLETCSRAGEKVFSAGALLGLGLGAGGQGRHAQALAWAERAYADYRAVRYEAGTHSAGLAIATSLMALGREPERARKLLQNAAAYYRRTNAPQALAEAEEALARLAQQRGDSASALAHMQAERLAAQAAHRSQRDRQLAYMQVQFDTRFNDQQIALLKTEASLAEVAMAAARSRQWLFAAGAALLLAVALLLGVLLRRTARERRRYRWQSRHDGLTRLYNYAHLQQLGEVAFARARAAGRPFSAVVLDIDLFKQVNDRHGHAAGDEALRALAGWIRQSVGERDLVGRRGGDEFALLCEGDAASAEAVVQCLRRLIGPVTMFGHSFLFTVSAGIREADAKVSSLAQLVHDADQALLSAKRTGRDRITRHRPDSEASADAPRAGRLVVVGSGIQFGRHVSERGLSEIREAETVLCLTDPYALAMIKGIRPDVVNLGLHYAPGKDRRGTYREIDAAIMAQVRAGKHVCAVFYGHPGVFADVPHRVIRQVRAMGLEARMEPGISAEACLYADLGIDPGQHGVQSMEATHFLCYDRKPDTAGLVLLWQVALSGDLTCTRLHAERYGLQALLDKLLRWYPPNHEVILYEAAQLPIDAPRIELLPLRQLPDAQYREYTTLAIPPLDALRDDPLRALLQREAPADSA